MTTPLSSEFQVVPEDFLVPGDIVASRYRVVRALGSGGFAQVYLASHVEIESMRVAIKVLHPHRTTPDALDRFRNEAKLLAMLQNRHTVRLIDFGVTEKGMAYLVMEYVRGTALDQLLRDRGRLHEADVARVAMGVLKALVEAHSVGVIHRDLKPANIVLVSEPGERYVVPRVLDFGIAKVMGGGSPVEDHILSEDGQWEPVVYCTPAYAAPELLRGRPDFATDLYALGLVLIELLEGAPPYQYPDPEPAASPHLWDSPVPLGDVVEASQLARVVERAVAKELDVRYASAEHMLADVEAAYEAMRRGAQVESALVVPEDERPPVPQARRSPSQAARFISTSVVGLAGTLVPELRRARERAEERAQRRDPPSGAVPATELSMDGASPTPFAPPAHEVPPPVWETAERRRALAPTPEAGHSRVVEVALFGQRMLSTRPTWLTFVIVVASIALPAIAVAYAVSEYLRG